MSKTVFETFRKINEYQINNLIKKEPDCWNGEVSFKKYSVTIEEILETKEIYAERLQKLWEECDNHHHYQPIKAAAAKLGIKLESTTYGIRRGNK